MLQCNNSVQQFHMQTQRFKFISPSFDISSKSWGATLWGTWRTQWSRGCQRYGEAVGQWYFATVCGYQFGQWRLWGFPSDDCPRVFSHWWQSIHQNGHPVCQCSQDKWLEVGGRFWAETGQLLPSKWLLKKSKSCPVVASHFKTLKISCRMNTSTQDNEQFL